MGINPLSSQMESIYREMPADQIPWNLDSPPDALVELLKTGKVKPCKAIDLGCGTGNYTIYLASQGFEMTGIDLSLAATEIAGKKAVEKQIPCKFIAADISKDVGKVKETFRFAFDWDVLHHVFPRRRRNYVENVARLLDSEGLYYSVCFSEQDPHFGGTGKYRKTPIGTELYFSSERELKALFNPLFHIEEFKIIEVSGKLGPHKCWSVLMHKP